MDSYKVAALENAAHVLNLPSNCIIDFTLVRKCFCKIVKKSHPDRNFNSNLQFYTVIDAYNVLKDYFCDYNSHLYCRDYNISFVDTISLSDVTFDEKSDSYSISCRCGYIIRIPNITISLGIFMYTCDCCSCNFKII